MLYPIPPWIRVSITGYKDIGDFIQLHSPESDCVDNCLDPTTPPGLVPDFLYDVLGATTWNYFASAASYCHVMYHRSRMIVSPHCREIVDSHCVFRHLLALKHEMRGKLTAVAIGAAVSEGANRSWTADQESQRDRT